MNAEMCKGVNNEARKREKTVGYRPGEEVVEVLRGGKEVSCQIGLH